MENRENMGLKQQVEAEIAAMYEKLEKIEKDLQAEYCDGETSWAAQLEVAYEKLENEIATKETAQGLVDKIKEDFSKLDLSSAWKSWCKLYDLFEASENATSEERLELFKEQQKFISQIEDEIVYAVTDYGREVAYQKMGYYDDISADETEVVEEAPAPERYTVLVVEPNKKPYLKEIDSGLESLQHEVGGYIQAIYPFEEPVAVICNEEGKLEGLPLNRALRDEDGDVYDVIVGTFLIAGLTDEGFGSLSEEYQKKFFDHFQHRERFIYTSKGIVVEREISPRTSLDEMIRNASSALDNSGTEEHFEKTKDVQERN